MPSVMDRELVDRAQSLAQRLKDSRGRLERHLSSRLLAIVDAPEAEREAKIRGSLSLYDWNLFQTTINWYQVLADEFRAHLDPVMRALAADCEEDVRLAKDAQDVIHALLQRT